MNDIGTLLGSIMVGLLDARRIADEQTAALAEYYKNSNSPLAGLTVPRIRIPEFTIDMPFLIENALNGEDGEIADYTQIAKLSEAVFNSKMTGQNTRSTSAFRKTYTADIKKELESLKSANAPVMRENVVRKVQDTFITALNKSKMEIPEAKKEEIIKLLRTEVSKMCIVKEVITPKLMTTVNTSAVKENASSSTVVRLKITLKEEGLEWSTQSNEAGGTINTLQVE